MGDRCGMSISADSPSDETLNRGPLALLLRRQYEFPSGINIVQFSNFFLIFLYSLPSSLCPLVRYAYAHTVDDMIMNA